MEKGTVKWFDMTKRFGFIQPASGGQDVFVHITAVQEAGISELSEGQSVHYDLKKNDNKLCAINLKLA